MELWGGDLDDATYQASRNIDVDEGKLYQVRDFWNNVGTRNPISSARIGGCANQGVELMDEHLGTLRHRCLLMTGDYKTNQFISRCGNDLVTHYKSHGKLL